MKKNSPSDQKKKKNYKQKLKNSLICKNINSLISNLKKNIRFFSKKNKSLPNSSSVSAKNLMKLLQVPSFRAKN